jgi:hypothetical protein
MERIYFQATKFFKGTATAEAWRMESVMEPSYVVNYLCCFSLAPVYTSCSPLLLLLLLSTLQQCALCTPIVTEQQRDREAELLKYTLGSNFLLKDRNLYEIPIEKIAFTCT